MSDNNHTLTCFVEVPSPAYMTLKGHLTADFLADGPLPVNIISCRQSAKVKITIDFDGSELARLLCLDWCAKVSFESIGAGPEFSLQSKKINHRVCNEKKVEIVIDIPAGQFVCDPNECGTAYLMTVTVLAFDGCGVPAPFSGYCQGATIIVNPN